MDTEYHFMVDFTLPDTLSEEFMSLIPFQRTLIKDFFTEGKLLNYALSLENAKLWAIFNANNELDVMNMIADLPLTRFMKVEISMLTFFNSEKEAMPSFSMN